MSTGCRLPIDAGSPSQSFANLTAVRLCAAFATTATVACTSPAPAYDPFIAPAETVFEAIEAIVATPLSYPGELRVSDSASQRIGSLIEAELTAAGIRVVSADEYSDVWDRILRQMGGFFDPVTGERDEVKFQATRRELLRELRGRFGTAVMLYSELQIVEAEVADGVAKWDGTSQLVIGGDSRIERRFADTFEQDMFGSNLYGTIGAVSLVLAIDGTEGEELYRSFGGVEVLSTAAPGNGDAGYALVADSARVEYAVGIVVKPLSQAVSR